MRLLLDAHIILWLLYEPHKLADHIRLVLEDPATRLFVSLATVWEIVNKVGAYRLPLAGYSVDEVMQRIEDLGVTLLPIRQDNILAAAKLPRHHADPFDRILVAQAQAHSLTLVTVDTDILRYDVPVL